MTQAEQQNWHSVKAAIGREDDSEHILAVYIKSLMQSTNTMLKNTVCERCNMDHRSAERFWKGTVDSVLASSDVVISRTHDSDHDFV